MFKSPVWDWHKTTPLKLPPTAKLCELRTWVQVVASYEGNSREQLSCAVRSAVSVFLISDSCLTCTARCTASREELAPALALAPP